MPPLSTQEQDDQQCNDETENCSTFGQSSTQQQVSFSDFICIFAMPDEGLFDYFFATLS